MCTIYSSRKDPIRYYSILGVASHPEQSAAQSKEATKQSPISNLQSQDAGALADELGCLPLALEQAGAYIEASGVSLRDYLALFRTRHRELLAHPPATDYPATVATTWEISFNAIAAPGRDSIAPQLLNLLAFFAPEAIPREVLQTRRVSETLRVSMDDDLALNAAVMLLRRYSLVQYSEGMFAMHRLVQTIVRDRMDDATRKTFAEIALHCVNDAFPFESDDVRTWADCARLNAHTRAVTDEAERLGIAPEATARLLNQVASYLHNRAELAEAKTLFERALAIDEATFGPNHPNVAIRVNNLGSVLRDLGDLPRAQACFERALKIFLQFLPPDHPNIKIVRGNLERVQRTKSK